MRKAWKAYLSLALCIVMIGSNSAFAYASETQSEPQNVEGIEDTAEDAEDIESTEGTEGTESTETTEDLEESDESSDVEGTESTEGIEESETQNVEMIGELTEGSDDVESTEESEETESQETTLPDGNPVIAADMPELETLSEAVIGTTYTVEYNPKAPYEDKAWMKYTPEVSGVYLLKTNDGGENVYTTSGNQVYTAYTYCDQGLLQYLEAGTTYVLSFNGGYYGSGILEFSVEKAKEVKALKVTKAPTKTTYYNNFGEDLDSTGMKVRVTYTDGSYEVITLDGNTWNDLDSGYSLIVEEAWGENYFDIYINNFESFPSITYKVNFVDATGLTKYTSGYKITFTSGEKVKYLKFVPSSTGTYTMEPIGMTNIYASLMDSSTGKSTLSLTKGKTYHLRVENYSGMAGTARVYITKKVENKKVLKNFEITKQPYQTEFYYKPGKTVEVCPAGMEITATYTDGTKEVLRYTYRDYVRTEDESIWFGIDDITLSNPKEGTHTLTISVNDYDITDSYTITLKPYPEETEPTLAAGTTQISFAGEKAYYNSYVIPEDGVYYIGQSFEENYDKRSNVITLGDDTTYGSGTRELTKGTVVYFYILNYSSESIKGELTVQYLHSIGATITDFEWTTPPQEEILAYYAAIRGEGVVTYSDGSTAAAGVPVHAYVLDKPSYSLNIETEFADGKDYEVKGEREITYTVGVKSGDSYTYTEVDSRTIEVVGPSTYNGGPVATIKKNQAVKVNAAAIGDDYVAYKFVPTKTAAYRMIINGETGLSSGHEYAIFTETDGEVICVDSTNASGYFVDREVLTKGETYYVVFPLSSEDNFTFTCRENKAVQGITGYITSELQLKGSTVPEVLKNAVITVNFKDGTSENLDNSNWTYYENEDGTGYCNTDSYYNVYTVSLGKTQGTTKKLTTDRQMITVCQEMNYGYSVDLGYVKANGYKITFNKNGGTYLSKASKVVASGSALGTLPTAKRKGYVLKGWYTAKTGGTKFLATTKIGKSRTLYARWTKVTTPAKVKKPTLTNLSGKKMKVAYKKVTNAKGYQIVYSTSSKFTSSTTKKVINTSLSKTITGLKKGKTYYVKVRAYKTDSYGNKIYGSYSIVNKVTIKK